MAASAKPRRNPFGQWFTIPPDETADLRAALGRLCDGLTDQARWDLARQCGCQRYTAVVPLSDILQQIIEGRRWMYPGTARRIRRILRASHGNSPGGRAPIRP